MRTLDDIMWEIEGREARNDVLRQIAKDNGSLYRVFDWDRAAKIIRDKKPLAASAGLIEDWFWTGGTIYEDGKPNEDRRNVYLMSYWATPTLILKYADDREKQIPCWRLAEEVGWDQETWWPDSARKILGV